MPNHANAASKAVAVAYEVNRTTLSTLVNPSWITVLSPTRIAVGSSNPGQNRMMVFDDDGGSFSMAAALSDTFVDGLVEGGRPGPCVTVPGKAYLFCGSGNYLSQADAGIDAGIDGHLWKWTPGAPPVK